MLIRLLILVLLLSACRSDEILCPEPKKVRAKRVVLPRQNMLKQTSSKRRSFADFDKNLQSRNKSLQRMREQQLEARASKTPEAAEDWDCPKPGVKRHYSRVVKENIRRNKKKIKSYYKERMDADSVFTFLPSQNPK